MNGTNLGQYLAKSIAILVFGSNDYLNNYLLPSLYSSSYIYSPPDYANLLLNRYTRQILVYFTSLFSLIFFLFYKFNESFRMYMGLIYI